MALKETPKQILARLRAVKLLRIEKSCVQFAGGSKKEADEFCYACTKLHAEPGTYSSGAGKQFTFNDPTVFAEVFSEK